METMQSNWQCWESTAPVTARIPKESKVKLSLETRNRGGVIVVHCQGRIVYRDEAAALSRVVDEILKSGSKLVLDLSGVTAMDSDGIGELALLQTWEKERSGALKCAGGDRVGCT